MKEKKSRVVLLGGLGSHVPPVHYSGVERIIDALALGLLKEKIAVDVFARSGSSVHYPVVHWKCPDANSTWQHFRNVQQIISHTQRYRGERIIIHGFSKLGYALALNRLGIPTVHSYQLQPTVRNVIWAKRLSLGQLTITACSQSMLRDPRLKSRVCVINNMVPLEVYSFVERVSFDAPFVFLGRIHRQKGVHTAIQVAKKTGRRLIIAGIKADGGEERQYWDQEIAPFIDGDSITYIGPVTDLQKNELLGHATALLFPVQWEEPFGIVMIEAMACGTPVIAFGRGAVREVVKDGISGFICDDIEQMLRKISAIDQIDRSICRRLVEEHFSDRVIVGRYLDLYERELRVHPIRGGQATSR
jgi:glycosyltransferase involved in cell wall biosynthesis